MFWSNSLPVILRRCQNIHNTESSEDSARVRDLYWPEANQIIQWQQNDNKSLTIIESWLASDDGRTESLVNTGKMVPRPTAAIKTWPTSYQQHQHLLTEHHYREKNRIYKRSTDLRWNKTSIRYNVISTKMCSCSSRLIGSRCCKL